MKYPKDTIIRWVLGPGQEAMSRKAAKRAYRALGCHGKRAGQLARTETWPTDPLQGLTSLPIPDTIPTLGGA